jgi:hypothetical protein
MPADRHPVELLRLGRQGFGVEDGRNIQTAMADVYSETDFFSHIFLNQKEPFAKFISLRSLRLCEKPLLVSRGGAEGAEETQREL